MPAQPQQQQQQQVVYQAAVAQPAQAVVEEVPGLDRGTCEKMVMGIVVNAIGSDEDVGLDSLSSVAFRNDLQRAVGFNLGAALIFDYPTPRLIVDFLVESSQS